MSEQLDLAALFAHPANGGLRPIAGADPSVVWRELVVASAEAELPADGAGALAVLTLSLIHISEPTRLNGESRVPGCA